MACVPHDSFSTDVSCWCKRRLARKSLNTDSCEQAAIHEVVATRAECRFVRREESCEFSDLFGCADATKWMSFTEALEYFFHGQALAEVRRRAGEHRRADGAWT